MSVQKNLAQSVEVHALNSSGNSSDAVLISEAQRVSHRRRIPGTVVERAGAWQAQRYAYAPNGSRRRQSATFTTEAEAWGWLQSLPVHLKAGARRTLGDSLETALLMNELGTKPHREVKFLRTECTSELTTNLDDEDEVRRALSRILSRRAEGTARRGNRQALAVALAAPVRKVADAWAILEGEEWKPITFRTHKADALRRLDVALTRLEREGEVLRTQLLNDADESLGFIRTLLAQPIPVIRLVERRGTGAPARKTVNNLRQVLVRMLSENQRGLVPRLPRTTAKERAMKPEGAAFTKERLTLAVGERGRRPSGEALERVLLAARRIGQALDAPPAARCVSLIAATGLRSGEALGLRWGDLDAAAKMLQVNGTKTENAERRILVEPKKMERLCGGIVAELVAWRGDAPDDAVMFPVTADELLRQMRAVTLEAGLRWSPVKRERLWVHGLRHAFGRYALWCGQPVQKLSHHLGHSDWAFTAKLYADSTSDPLE
jgi:integrase